MTDAELIQRIDDAKGDLREREVEFIADQVDRLGRVGDLRFKLSKKQRRWAEDILERVE